MAPHLLQGLCHSSNCIPKEWGYRIPAFPRNMLDAQASPTPKTSWAAQQHGATWHRQEKPRETPKKEPDPGLLQGSPSGQAPLLSAPLPIRRRDTHSLEMGATQAALLTSISWAAALPARPHRPQHVIPLRQLHLVEFAMVSTYKTKL